MSTVIDFPAGDIRSTNATITKNVKTLLTYRGMEVATFCALMGMKEGTYYGRGRGGDWRAWETQKAADVLGVSAREAAAAVELYLRPRIARDLHEKIAERLTEATGAEYIRVSDAANIARGLL